MRCCININIYGLWRSAKLSEGYQQNKLPLIPMEGKVQINSYSHFNVFMLMQVHRERTANPQEEGGVKVESCT